MQTEKAINSTKQLEPYSYRNKSDEADEFQYWMASNTNGSWVDECVSTPKTNENERACQDDTNETILDAVSADPPFGCKIYNIPNGATLIQIAMLFEDAQVLNINLPGKDRSYGHVTFADRKSLWLVMDRTDLIVNGQTLECEPDPITETSAIGQINRTAPVEQSNGNSAEQKTIGDTVTSVNDDNATLSRHTDVVPTQFDNANHQTKALALPEVAKPDTEVPQHGPFTCFVGIPPNQTDEDISELIGGFIVDSFILDPINRCVEMQLRERSHVLQLIRRSFRNGSSFRLSETANSKITVNSHQNPKEKPPQNGQIKENPSILRKSPALPQQRAAPKPPEPLKAAENTLKPLTDKHIVLKGIDNPQISMEPPFLCKFGNLPSYMAKEDIGKVLGSSEIAATNNVPINHVLQSKVPQHHPSTQSQDARVKSHLTDNIVSQTCYKNNTMATQNGRHNSDRISKNTIYAAGNAKNAVMSNENNQFQPKFDAKLCSPLIGNNLGVKDTNDPRFAFFVPNDYFEKVLSGQCVLCGNISRLTCATCGRFYCNVECQRTDWPSHSTICTKIPNLVTAAEFLTTPQASSVLVHQAQITTMGNPKAIAPQTAGPSVIVTASTSKPKKTIQKVNAPVNAARPIATDAISLKEAAFSETIFAPMVRAAIQVPCCDIPKPGSNVTITEVVDESTVFIRPLNAELDGEHAAIEHDITAYAFSARALTEEPVIQQVVLALCRRVKQYLRASILKKIADDRWKVVFVDRGYIADVCLNECRELSGDLQALRRLIHKCTLAVPKKINADAVNRLNKLRGSLFRITYAQPFTRFNPIHLQMIPNGKFVQQIISE